MRYLLNQRELEGLQFTESLYRERFHDEAVNDEDLFVHLGDNPARFLCWSAVSGRVPTFRTGSGFIYSPARDQYLLPRDKLACSGFPVDNTVAASMGVPMIPIADRFRAGSIAGNSFHFTTVAVVQMVALSCYRLATD